MKRAFLAILTLLSLAIPLTAHAEWVTKEIKWRISGIGPMGTSTSIWVRDTTYNALGGGASDVGDTTSSFTLDDAAVPPRGAALSTGSMTNVTGTGAGPYVQADTTVLAWILIQADSSTATTATATNITMLIDGRVGGLGTFAATLGEGWVKADSTFINGAAGGTMATGNDSYGIPIRTISPYGNVQRWPALRARLSPATGSVPGARVFLRYYRPSVSTQN